MPKIKHRAEPKSHKAKQMDKVKIKRVKRTHKTVSTKEKILGGLGVGSALIGGAGAVSAKPATTQFVRTTDTESTATSKIKSVLKDVFGINKQAKAYVAPSGSGTVNGTSYSYTFDQQADSGRGAYTLSIGGGALQTINAADLANQISLLNNPNNPDNGQLGSVNSSVGAVLTQLYYGTPENPGVYQSYGNVVSGGGALSFGANGSASFDFATGNQNLTVAERAQIAQLVDAYNRLYVIGSGTNAQMAAASAILNAGNATTNGQSNYIGDVYNVWLQLQMHLAQLASSNAAGENGSGAGTTLGAGATIQTQTYTNTVRTWTITDAAGMPAKDGAAMPGFTFNIQLTGIDPAFTNPTVKIVFSDGTEVDPTNLQFSSSSMTFKMPNSPNIAHAKGDMGVRVKLTQGAKTAFLKYSYGDFSVYGYGQLSPSMLPQIRAAAGVSQLAGLTDKQLADAVLKAMGENGWYNVGFITSDAKFSSTQGLAYIRDGVPQAVSLSGEVGLSMYQAMVNDGTALAPAIANDTILTEFTINPGAVNYRSDLVAQGFSGPVTWSASALPPGITLNSSTGRLSGMPTTPGSYSFTVRASAGSQTATKQFTVNIYAPNVVATNPPAISSISNNDIPQGGSINIQISGYKLNTATLSFPASSGLSISNQSVSADGTTISATIRASTSANPGSYPLTVNIPGVSNLVVTPGALNFNVVAANAPIISIPDLLPDAPVGQAYSFTGISASNVTSPRWSIQTDSPIHQAQLSWLSINPSTGALSGTPVERGDFGFYIVATYTKSDGSVGTVNKFVSLHATQDYWDYTAGIPNVNTTPASNTPPSGGASTPAAGAPTISQVLYNNISGSLTISGSNFNTTTPNGNAIEIINKATGSVVKRDSVSSGSPSVMVYSVYGMPSGNYSIKIATGNLSSGSVDFTVPVASAQSDLTTKKSGGTKSSPIILDSVTGGSFESGQITAPSGPDTAGLADLGSQNFGGSGGVVSGNGLGGIQFVSENLTTNIGSTITPRSASFDSLGGSTLTGTNAGGNQLTGTTDVSTGNASISTAANLPGGAVGQSYQNNTFKLVAICPTSNIFQWTVSEGRLPAGMTLAYTGELRGTPTESGTFTFRALATSQIGLASSSRVFTLTIAPSSGTTTTAQAGDGEVEVLTESGGLNNSNGVSAIPDGEVEVLSEGTGSGLGGGLGGGLGSGGSTGSIYRDSVTNVADDDANVSPVNLGEPGAGNNILQPTSPTNANRNTDDEVEVFNESLTGGVNGLTANGAGNLGGGGGGQQNSLSGGNGGSVANSGNNNQLVTNLQTQVTDLQSRINSLNSQIASLQASGAGNSSSAQAYLQQINQLQQQVTSLNATIARLQQNSSSVRVFDQQTGLLQYADIVPKNQVAGATASDATYTVKKGDTLWNISQKYYGSGAKWRQILAANPGALSKPGNTKTLRVGFVLNIPSLTSSKIQTYENSSVAPKVETKAAVKAATTSSKVTAVEDAQKSEQVLASTVKTFENSQTQSSQANQPLSVRGTDTSANNIGGGGVVYKDSVTNVREDE